MRNSILSFLAALIFVSVAPTNAGDAAPKTGNLFGNVGGAAPQFGAAPTVPAGTVFTPILRRGAAPDGAELEFRLAIPQNFYLYAERLTLRLPEGVSAKLTAAPAPDDKDHEPAYVGDAVLRYALTAANGAAISTPFAFTITYQECDEKICYLPKSKKFSIDFSESANESFTAPETTSANRAALNSASAAALDPVAEWASLADDFTTVGAAAGYLNTTEFLQWLGGDNAAGVENQLNDLRQNYGLWLVALCLIPLGVLLNLTPCVLPLIPINLAIIGAEKRRGAGAE
jgi:thiol:disulfide interchange protein